MLKFKIHDDPCSAGCRSSTSQYLKDFKVLPQLRMAHSLYSHHAYLYSLPDMAADQASEIINTMLGH